MRNANEIIEEWNDGDKSVESKLFLELLLDIRDLLKDKQN